MKNDENHCIIQLIEPCFHHVSSIDSIDSMTGGDPIPATKAKNGPRKLPRVAGSWARRALNIHAAQCSAHREIHGPCGSRWTFA